MRRVLHIALAAAMAALCVLPAAGQSYKASKVREKSEPEPLEFRKVFPLSQNDYKEIRTRLMRWECPGYDLSLSGFPVNSDGKYMSLNVGGLDFDGVKGSVSGSVGVLISGGMAILEFRNIYAGWGTHLVEMSKRDDSFNRTWLWRVNHNKEIVQAARERCEEIFDTLCASLDDFLKDGPPMELQRVN